MKRCWIHIGMHKTGSTSVQTVLSSIKSGENWQYLSVDGRINMNLAVYAMFAPDPHKYHWFAKLGMTEVQVADRGDMLRRKLRKSILKSKKENIIISAEVLSIVHKKGIQAMAKFLKPLCDEVRVIGYVRPPAGYKVSIFQQLVKQGTGKFNISNIKLNYQKRFEKFDQVFGKKNVLLRKFDPEQFPNKCLVADFCQQLGIELPANTTIKRTNESLCTEACGMLYAHRKLGPGYGVGKGVIQQNNMLIKPLLAMRGGKFKVSKTIVSKDPANEAEDLGWMETRIGTSLGEKFKDDGTEIKSEDDLLIIQRSSCSSYAALFTKIHGLKIEPGKIPTGNPVDPHQVAEFLEHCFELCKQKMDLKKAAAKAKLLEADSTAEGTPPARKKGKAGKKSAAKKKALPGTPPAVKKEATPGSTPAAKKKATSATAPVVKKAATPAAKKKAVPVTPPPKTKGSIRKIWKYVKKRLGN